MNPYISASMSLAEKNAKSILLLRASRIYAECALSWEDGKNKDHVTERGGANIIEKKGYNGDNPIAQTIKVTFQVESNSLEQQLVKVYFLMCRMHAVFSKQRPFL